MTGYETYIKKSKIMIKIQFPFGKFHFVLFFNNIFVNANCKSPNNLKPNAFWAYETKSFSDLAWNFSPKLSRKCLSEAEKKIKDANWAVSFRLWNVRFRNNILVWNNFPFTVDWIYTASQKNESTILHTYVLNEFLTANRSSATKYLKENSYRSR